MNKELEVGGWKLEAKASSHRFARLLGCESAQYLALSILISNFWRDRKFSRPDKHRFLPTSNFQLPTHNGFTLIEMLIVIVIVGVLVGVVTLSIGVIPQRELRAEADRLKMSLQHCSDTALFNQQTLGWLGDEETNSYQVKIFDDLQGWLESDSALLKTWKLPDDIELSIDEPFIDESTPPANDNEGEDSEEEKKPPQLVFLSSGEYQPFRLTLSRDNGSAWIIAGDGIGKIQLLPGDQNGVRSK